MTPEDLIRSGKIEDALRIIKDMHWDSAELAYCAMGCQIRPAEEWRTFLDHAGVKTKQGIYSKQIHKAIASWLLGDVERLEKDLGELDPFDGNKSLLIYERFLKKLLAYRKQYPELYAGDVSSYIVGDSHSLSYANVNCSGRIMAHLISGAKAHHIATRKEPYYTAFLKFLSRTPKATIILSFGEIDCRIEGGILSHSLKTGGNLKDIVANQVRNYVSEVMSHGFDCKFLLLPAPMEERKREIVNMFNSELVKTGRFIEVRSCYIDNIHLTPNAILTNEFY